MAGPETYYSEPAGRAPNNPLALLVYRNAVPGGGAAAFYRQFQSQG
ncbi:hypothetical protein [Actibacterium mucosum]|nr:hypothetical protein [Actibacterium mucosum]